MKGQENEELERRGKDEKPDESGQEDVEEISEEAEALRSKTQDEGQATNEGPTAGGAALQHARGGSE
jgi:hypothetical protein